MEDSSLVDETKKNEAFSGEEKDEDPKSPCSKEDVLLILSTSCSGNSSEEGALVEALDDDENDDDGSQQKQQQQLPAPVEETSTTITKTTTVSVHFAAVQQQQQQQASVVVGHSPDADALQPASSSISSPPGATATSTTTATVPTTSYTSTTTTTTTTTTLAAAPSASKRLYRLAENKWVTRDIAALDFLLGIPLQQEAELVYNGWIRLQSRGDNCSDDFLSKGGGGGENDAFYLQRQLLPQHQQQRWWEKWIKAQQTTVNPTASDQLEGPTREEKGDLATAAAASSRAAATGDKISALATTTATSVPVPATATRHIYAPPGRRLEGDKAFYVKIPVTTTTNTKQKSIARVAALREWELRTAHGLMSSSGSMSTNHPPLLNGRLFFSAGGSYPISVFSMQRYEPRKEEAALRRQKLEARGGGGTQYVMPTRDWRGVSYRSLLPREREKEDRLFNRFLKKNKRPLIATTSSQQSPAAQYQQEHKGYFQQQQQLEDDDELSINTESSDESDIYVPGLLDDPEMVLGRHRTVMIGDRVTGPIVASTIQFVEPSLLKKELNKQFRERFDGWEPPRAARMYIGARVVDGVYMLMDPTTASSSAAVNNAVDDNDSRSIRTSVASISSASDGGGGGSKEKQIRMPPSLTLSKIRSLKNQVLKAALKANLEIGTVALACVYFERLCLDCRVDKSNRRVSMAACLLLASKINEPNVGMFFAGGASADEATSDVNNNNSNNNNSSSNMNTNNTNNNTTNNNMATKLQSFVRPTKRSNTMFASLLEFFTEEWSLSLKHLFAAEWGVFAALGFSLLAEPSQVAFHFKRFMKTLEWNPRNYLGDEMYDQWQESLAHEEERRKERERRREMFRQRKEEELLNLHLEIENDRFRRQNDKEDASNVSDIDDLNGRHNRDSFHKAGDVSPGKLKKSGISFLHRFSMRRNASSERLRDGSSERVTTREPSAQPSQSITLSEHRVHSLATNSGKRAGKGTLPFSPSLPTIANTYVDSTIAIDMPDESQRARSETSSLDGYESGGIIV